MEPLRQQAADVLHDHVFAVTTAMGLVIVGLFFVFLGWLKYKQRKQSPKRKTEKPTGRKRKRK